MKHSSEYDLALYVGGELGWFRRWQVGTHTRSCSACRAKLEEFVQTREQVRDLAAPLPENLDWSRLSSEMVANIHLGLSAGECVAIPTSRASRQVHLTGWRPASVFAGALLVVALAWFSNSTTPRIPTNLVHLPAAPQGVVLETSSSSIEVNDHGRVLSLMHPNSKDNDVVFSVNLQGSVRARFVDSESGQVTINNAYVQ